MGRNGRGFAGRRVEPTGDWEQIELLCGWAGQRFDYHSFPTMGRNIHSQDPSLYAATLREWSASLPDGQAVT